MLATAGLGRRVIFIAELLTQYISAGSRVWIAYADDRPWIQGATDRIWNALAGVGRAYRVVVPTRVWEAIELTRSWLVSKLRAWSGSTDRSHDA